MYVEMCFCTNFFICCKVTLETCVSSLYKFNNEINNFLVVRLQEAITATPMQSVRKDNY